MCQTSIIMTINAKGSNNEIIYLKCKMSQSMIQCNSDVLTNKPLICRWKGHFNSQVASIKCLLPGLSESWRRSELILCPVSSFYIWGSRDHQSLAACGKTRPSKHQNNVFSFQRSDVNYPYFCYNLTMIKTINITRAFPVCQVLNEQVIESSNQPYEIRTIILT